MTNKNALKIGFAASITPVAQAAYAALTTRYGNVALEEADIIVALGGARVHVANAAWLPTSGCARLRDEPWNDWFLDERIQ